MESIMANPDQRQLIWDRHLALMDYNSELISARQEGLEEGLEKGLEEGFGKGHDSANRKNAKAMKEKHYPVEDISEITGLSGDEIAAL